MACLRNISVDTLHKGATEDNNNVTNVKCKLWCVRFYMEILVFSGLVCRNGYS